MQPGDEDQAAAFIAGLDGEAQRHAAAMADGGTTIWRRFGAGPHLVLLHGGHGNWLHWARNIRPLARRFTVWVPDMLGYGESTTPGGATLADMVAGTLQSLDALVGPATPVRLAGFSFGGLVAAALAARRGAVSHLALLGPAGHGGTRRPRGELRPWRAAQNSGDLAALADTMRHNLLMHMLHAPEAADDLALHIHTQACLHARFHSKPLSRAGGLADALAGCRGRLLLAWGEHDVTAVPDTAAAMLKQGRSNAQVAVVPGAGHWVQYEAAGSINNLLAAWLHETVACTAVKE